MHHSVYAKAPRWIRQNRHLTVLGNTSLDRKLSVQRAHFVEWGEKEELSLPHARGERMPTPCRTLLPHGGSGIFHAITRR